MVAHETLDSKPILSVVSIMELVGVLARKAEVVLEELV
jgi:hypothetical protein